MICQFCAKFVSTSLSKLVQEIQISFLFGFVLIINYSGSNHFSFISFHRKPNGWDLMQNSQNTLLKSDLATLFALGSLLLDWSWCVSPAHSGSWPLVTNCNWLAPSLINSPDVLLILQLLHSQLSGSNQSWSVTGINQSVVISGI